MSFGSNFTMSQADSERNRAALDALEFHVHADMFMNPTAECADIVLPANMPWERDALKIGFEITQAAVETIQFRPRMLEPVGESRADYDIVAALAVRLDMADAFFGGDIVAGWNHQLAPLGVTVDDLRRHPDGQRFEQSFRHEKYAIARDGGHVAAFATPTRRVELYSELMRDHGYAPLPGHVEPAESPLRETADPSLSTGAHDGKKRLVHSFVASPCRVAAQEIPRSAGRDQFRARIETRSSRRRLGDRRNAARAHALARARERRAR